MSEADPPAGVPRTYERSRLSDISSRAASWDCEVVREFGWPCALDRMLNLQEAQSAQCLIPKPACYLSSSLYHTISKFGYVYIVWPHGDCLYDWSPRSPAAPHVVTVFELRMQT
jgi:hypothetical protein